jgi:protein-ribulosamine 3-kinase
MALTAPTLVPRLIGLEISEDGGEAGMVSEYFDLSSARSPEIQKQLGRKLAEMHRVPLPEDGGREGYTGKFGFDVPTFCGVTEQDNRWEEDWGVFFRDRRLGDMVRRIDDKDISKVWEGMKEK